MTQRNHSDHASPRGPSVILPPHPEFGEFGEAVAWLAGRSGMSRRGFIKGVIASGVAVAGVPYLANASPRPALQSGAAERLISLDVNGQTRRVDVLPNETLVTANTSHHSMEPRSAMAYWQNGKCYLYGSTQSQSFIVPGLASYLGIEPDDLVYIAEFCGGGFGSKGGAYPIMTVPAFMAKKTGRPVLMRISRAEENFIGSARPGFQGRIKMGFREDGRITAVDLYIVQENGPNSGGGDWNAAAGAVSLVYTPPAMRFRGMPVLTNTPATGAQRGPGQNQIATAGDRPGGDPPNQRSGQRHSPRSQPGGRHERPHAGGPRNRGRAVRLGGEEGSKRPASRL